MFTDVIRAPQHEDIGSVKILFPAFLNSALHEDQHSYTCNAKLHRPTVLPPRKSPQWPLSRLPGLAETVWRKVLVMAIIIFFQIRRIKNYSFGDQLVDIPKNKIFKNSLIRPAGRMWPLLILLFFFFKANFDYRKR